MATAWGEVKMNFAETNEDETMPANLSTIGEILEETLSIEKEDGAKLQLFREGHILHDELAQEPILRVNATLIGIPEASRAAFWDASPEGEGAALRYKVKSLINSKKFAIQFAAVKVPGSDTFEAPKCTIEMSPLYSSTQGWTATIVITIMKTKDDLLFQFGKVPA
jgi:hypothetical protein